MPKMIKDKFDKALTYYNLEKAYLSCVRGKRSRNDIIKFEMNREYNLTKIYNQLKEGTYKFGSYREFKVYEPKERIVLAACFKDRIIHTWYVKSFIDTIFYKQFIDTSYACIINRGTHKCVQDVQKAMRKYEDECYILKMDVTKYFSNIDKDILLNIIKRKVSDEKILNLTRDILDSCYIIPIGNYTSQMFANIYLNEVDQYCKHILKCKDYFRYMDDTVIMCKNKEDAKYKLKMIKTFLQEKLKLELNSKTNIFKVKQGINFCGYKIYKDYIKIRTRCKKNLYRKIKYIKKNNIKDYSLLLNGHIGYLKYSNYFSLVKNIQEKYGIKLKIG